MQVDSGLRIIPGETINQYNPIAGFDLDWTLTRNVHGKFFKDEFDWRFLSNRITTLRYYKDKGYNLVIFTNQAYKGKKSAQSLIRINNINNYAQSQGLNMWWFISTTNDNYHKPNIGMWQKCLENMPNVNVKDSLFVGDAAGRIQDHAASDLGFANNVGIRFYIPEQIFPPVQIQIPITQSMYIFVGMPGSGKTKFYLDNLSKLGYVHINQDIMKSMPKMIKSTELALQQGQSVAIDNTNPTIEKRRQFIDLAIKYRVPTMILHFVADGQGWNSSRQNPVPQVAYNIYFSKLVEPSERLEGVPVAEILY